MPGLVDAGGPLVIDSGDSTNLSAAVIPTPDDPAWTVVEGASVATQGTLATPTPDFFLRDLVDAGGPGDHIFDRIHVIPRVKNLGAVISDQEFEVEVWNAARALARVLDDITYAGSSGVSIVDPPTLPDHWPSTESRLFTVAVEESGDVDLDATITWVFLEIDPAGTDLQILGFRLLPFMFDPHMTDPIKERWGFLTDVLQAHDGTEQRIQLREVPVGSIAYSVLLTELRDAQMANAILFGSQARTLGIARWQFQTVLTADASVDATKIYLDPTDTPFENGGLVYIWASPFGWEAQTIDTVDGDGLTLSLRLKKSWPAGSLVMPMVIGRFNSEETINWEALGKASQEVEFSIDGFTP